MPIWNTGGWVVETPAADPNRGASLLVLDGDGDAAAVRLFDEAQRLGWTWPRVAPARVAALWTRDDAGGRQFAERVRDAVQGGGGPWGELRDAVQAAADVRRERLRAQAQPEAQEAGGTG